MAPEIVPGMAEKIEARRVELDLSLNDLVAAAGLTRQGLAPYRKGERRNYNDKAKRSLARALRWRHDAIDRLLLEQDPVPLEDEHLETIEASRRTTEAVTRFVEADLVFGLPDGTQIYVEVKGGGKLREAEVLRQLEELFSTLTVRSAVQDGRISEHELAAVASRARRAASKRRTKLTEAEVAQSEVRIAELDKLIAASRADAEEQTVEPRRRPAGDVPAEQEA